MGDAERKATLAAYDAGEIQVIVNVAVLTEGWDHPPTSCVVLLRPVFLQVHHDPDGRAGACAPSNPEEYPGRRQDRLHHPRLRHLEPDPRLARAGCRSRRPARRRAMRPPRPVRPARRRSRPPSWNARSAAMSGRAEREARRPGARSASFVMTEIDLLARSSFAWVDLFGDGAALMANGFTAWAGVFCAERPLVRASAAPRASPRVCWAWARASSASRRPTTGSTPTRPTRAPTRRRRWLRQPPTERQLAFLPPECRMDFGLTRYQASALLTFKFNQHAIRDPHRGSRGAPRLRRRRDGGASCRHRPSLPPRGLPAGSRASCSAPSAGSPARGFGWQRAAAGEPAAALCLVLLHDLSGLLLAAGPEVLRHG